MVANSFLLPPSYPIAFSLGRGFRTEITQGSEISTAATALFESDEFLEQCERVLMPASTSKAGVQSGATDLERSLRDIIQQVFAKKDALLKKSVQVLQLPTHLCILAYPMRAATGSDTLCR